MWTVSNILRTTLLGALLCGLLPGCGDTSVKLAFTWEQKPTDTVWVWARVEERPDPSVAGAVLAQAGPAPFVPGVGVDLKLPEVPVGDNRMVFVEVRGSAETGTPITHYGASLPFALRQGDQLRIAVPLVLRPPETGGSSGTFALTFGGEKRTHVNPEDIQKGTLTFRTSNAKRVTIANDAAFTLGQQTLGIDGEALSCTDVPATASVRECVLEGWDLLAGLPQTPDGQYGVWLRFIDRFGYASDEHSESVQLDSAPLAIVDSELRREDGNLYAVLAKDRILVRPGDSVEVRLEFSEPTGGPPTITVGEATFTASGLQADGTEQTIVAGPFEGAADGEIELVVTYVDRTGEEASQAVGTVVVDGTPPEPLNDVDQGRFMLRRAPWGAHYTGNLKNKAELQTCFAEGDACKSGDPFQPSDRILVRPATLQASEDAPPTWTCGNETATIGDSVTQGIESIALPSDYPAVCLQLADRAGNLSEQRLIRQVEVVATSANLAFGGGPTLTERPLNTAALLQPAQAQLDNGGRLDKKLDEVRPAARWRPLIGKALPTCTGHRAVTDYGAGEVVVYCGKGKAAADTPLTSPLWRWNGLNGRQVLAAAADAPTARQYPAFGYDRRAGHLVLTGGGLALEPIFDPSWAWNGLAWIQTSTGNAPTGVGGTAFWEPISGELVMQRGETGQGAENWTYRLRNGAWERFWPTDLTNDSIPNDGHSAIAVDEGRGAALSFGGRQLAGLYCSRETFVWLGLENWVRDDPGDPQKPTTTGPPARYKHATSYDPVRGHVVLFGGVDGCFLGPSLGDTWEHDGTIWNPVTPADPELDGNPAPRHSASMTWDPVRKTTRGERSRGHTGQPGRAGRLQRRNAGFASRLGASAC